jgi:hypothetical protein
MADTQDKILEQRAHAKRIISVWATIIERVNRPLYIEQGNSLTLYGDHSSGASRYGTGTRH